jgi:hypothetical protein
MDVDVAALHLLMEAALAGLKEAAVPDRLSPETTKIEGDKNETPSKNEGLNKTTKIDSVCERKSLTEDSQREREFDRRFEELLQQTTTNLTVRLSENRGTTDGSRQIDRKGLVESIELNHSPFIGEGKGLSMMLIVQIAPAGNPVAVQELHH